MRKLILVSVLLFLICGLWVFSHAAVPHLINYQGRLTDKSSTPLNGLYNITFRIYDAEAAGNLLWQGTYNSVSITKGIFNILLGDASDTGFNFSELAFDKPYWLEIKVGTDAPMTPRQRITASGYAISAENLVMLAQQGDIIFFDGSNWVKLGAGAAGQALKTQGLGANPKWDFLSGIPSNMQVFTSSVTWTNQQE